VAGGWLPNGDKVVGVRVSERGRKALIVALALGAASFALSAQVLALNPAAGSVKPSSAVKSGATINGWKLEQRSRVLGDQTLYVCPTAIKAVNRKDGVTILTFAPYEEVITFSTKTGKICRKSFSTADNPYARAVAMFSGIAHGQMPLQKVRDYRKGGLLWSEFKIPDSYTESRKAMFRRNEVSSSDPSGGIVVCFHLPMERRATDWVARLFCVPRSGGIPFDVTFSDVDGDKHSLVKTFNMESFKFVPGDFQAPKGLRTVKDPRSVIQDETATDAIEMMMSGSDRRHK